MKNLLIFFALPLLALDNSVRLYDASGSTQTSQPRTIHRYFAQGEFPSGTACVVGLNPTSSDDSTDSAATAKGRAQSYNATGLSAGSNTYRITCGTARTTGAATIQ